jgi:PAS domain S-box-containing protein
VLLAEDNAIARMALAGRLRDEGFEVELAEDGEVALQQARKRAPDVLIADVLMPRMDGFSLCRAIKEDPELKSVPVVFYSGTFVTEEDHRLAESVGASRILQKSGDITELSTSLRAVLEEYQQSTLYIPQQPLIPHTDIDKFYENVLTNKLTAKVNELEAERQALRESEQRYQQLVATIPDVIFVLSVPDFRATYIAPRAERLVGIPGEEALGSAERWLRLIHEADRERAKQELSRAVAEGRGLSIEFRMYHRNGGIRWIEGHSSLVFGEDGKPRELLGVLTDITERKRAEERLIESESRYRGLFEMMENGMAVHEVVYDAQGEAHDYRFLEVNPAFERLTGLGAEALIGRTVKEVMPGIEPEWIDDYLEVARSGEPKHFMRYSAELDRYYGVVAYRNAEHQFVALFADVTEQQKNEETIHNLAKFPEENPSPVLRITDSGTLLYANEASAILRQQWQLRNDEPLPDELFRKITEAREGDNQFLCNLGERWFSFLIRPVAKGGYINVYGREVTEEQRARQELVALNRVLHTLSEGNRTLVHARSEHSLLENICRVFTQEGDYPAAWVMLPSAEGEGLDCHVVDGPLRSLLGQWDWQRVRYADHAHPMMHAYRQGANVIISRGGEEAAAYGLEQAMTEAEIATVFLLPMRMDETVFGLIGVFSRLPHETQGKELELLEELASDLAFGVQSHRTSLAHEEGMKRLHDAMMATVEAVSIALEKRDPYTAGHQNRVASLSVAIAREMGYSEERIEGIRLGSMVHDIGKISVPAEILNRPGRLSSDEFGIIKAHPEAGYDILKGVDFPWPIAQMVLQHHERIDGSGYPLGLKGAEITEEARILAVADVVEAITSHRPYRPSLGLDIALAEVERGRGSAYDPQVVDACLSLFREKDFEWEGR